MTREIGQTVGRFKLLDVLQHDWASRRFRALDTPLGTEVMIELLEDALATDADFVQVFLKEAGVVSRLLHHANANAILEAGTTPEGDVYLVLELVRGRTLADLLEQQGVLPLDQARPLVRQIAAALDYIHGQLCLHRDVRPDNVIVGIDGHVTVAHVRLVPLYRPGLSGGDVATSDNLSIGPLHHVAPEEIRLDALRYPLSPATDVYSLGVMTYQLLSGRLPFAGSSTDVLRALFSTPPRLPPSLRNLRPDLPESVCDAVTAALAIDPAQRPASAGRFAGMLTGVTTGGT